MSDISQIKKITDEDIEKLKVDREREIDLRVADKNEMLKELLTTENNLISSTKKLNIDKDVLMFEIDKLNEKRETLKIKVDELRIEKKEFENEHNGQLNECLNELEIEKVRLNDVKRKIFSEKELLVNIRNKKLELEIKLEDIVKQVAEKAEKFSSIIGKIRKSQEDIVEIESNLKSLNEKYSDIQNDLNEKSEKSSILNAEIETKKLEFEKIKKVIADCLNQKKTEDNNLQELLKTQSEIISKLEIREKIILEKEEGLKNREFNFKMEKDKLQIEINRAKLDLKLKA